MVTSLLLSGGLWGWLLKVTGAPEWFLIAECVLIPVLLIELCMLVYLLATLQPVPRQGKSNTKRQRPTTKRKTARKKK